MVGKKYWIIFTWILAIFYFKSYYYENHIFLYYITYKYDILLKYEANVCKFILAKFCLIFRKWNTNMNSKSKVYNPFCFVTIWGSGNAVWSTYLLKGILIDYVVAKNIFLSLQLKLVSFSFVANCFLVFLM